MFQCHRKGVIIEVKENTIPYLIIVHYMVEQMNLAIIVLLKLPLVFHIEAIFQSLYAFFVHNHKNCLEFFKVAKTLASNS
jgi:hypothetical protein